MGGYFIGLLIVSTIVSYFFQAVEKTFWSMEEMASRIRLAFNIACMIGYRHHEQPLSSDPDHVARNKVRWTVSHFLGVYGLLLLFSVLLMGALFGISWLIMHFLSTNTEPLGNNFLKSLAVEAVMALFITAFLWLTGRLGISWERRSA